MRILDLGCGEGIELDFFYSGQGTIIGIDQNYRYLIEATRNYPQRQFCNGSAERLPFRTHSIDQVLSNVALPYMNIPRTLREVHRVLVPGGWFKASLHSLGFTLEELAGQSRVIFKLRRLPILLNGLVFHLTGWAWGESFQTERGIRIALGRAGFTNIQFSLTGRRWQVEARSQIK